MLNPEVLKCHEDLITLESYEYNKEKQCIIRFSYVKTLTYLDIWGPGGGGGGFNNQTGPIYIYIYHVKYGSNKMSANADLITCTTRENN